jgi:hypothetical protein
MLASTFPRQERISAAEAGVPRRDRFGEAELRERLLGVGGEQQAGTDLSQLGRALEDGNLEARPSERYGRG